MIILQVILLGVLQSLTEFFPFSNAAHIILLQRFFDYPKNHTAYGLVMDAGTLIAVFIYYAHDCAQMAKESPALLKYPFSKNKPGVFCDRPYALTLSFLLLSCAAALIFRFVFADAAHGQGDSLAGLGKSILFMGILILMTKKLHSGNRGAHEMNHRDAFLIGLAQGLAVFPGISRLGLTFMMALYLGFERKEAARYSFLLAIPYMLAALISKFSQGAFFYQSNQTALLLSFVAAIFSGVAVLAAFVRIATKGKFYVFSSYCFLFGIFVIACSVYSGHGF